MQAAKGEAQHFFQRWTWVMKYREKERETEIETERDRETERGIYVHTSQYSSCYHNNFSIIFSGKNCYKD